MSSSSDDECFEPSPDVAVRRTTTRRKAHTPSPQKVPRKKVLIDHCNVDDESDEDEVESDEEFVGSAPNRKEIAANNGRKRTAVRPAEEIQSSGGGNYDKRPLANGSGSSRSSEETENRPPYSSSANNMVVNDVLEDNSQPTNHSSGEQQGQSRPRKRLSIRAQPPTSEGRRSSLSAAPSEHPVPSAEVQTIYETCSQMFNANRISPQNAFNLKLLDCINQMINSPNYDKSNMQLTSSTVEIGTKIYVCRVDNAHSQVLTLASDVVAQQRRKRKDGGEGDNNEGVDNQDEPMNDEEGMGDEGGRRQKKKRVVKKRGKFVEEDNSKLLTGLEEQNVKFVTRRNVLKKKFSDMVYEDLGFDYVSHFLEPDEENPFKSEAEKADIMSRTNIPESYVNALEVTRLDFLPFNYVAKFDPESHDLWGRPLNDVERNRDEATLAEPNLPLADNDYHYDPAERPVEYAEEEGPDFNDTLGDALPFGDEDNNEDGLPRVSFHDIRNLDRLEAYFSRLKSLLKDSKTKYGWCGPTFVRPKGTWAGQVKGAKKAKIKKEPERVDFLQINWSDKANKFAPNQSARTVYDDKIIEEWSNQKVIIPFLGVELNSYEEDLDPIDFDDENDPNYLPPIFKLFSSRYVNILDLIKAMEKRFRHPSSNASTGAPDVGDNDMLDDGFDQDVEVPRDIAEDFCSQPVNDDGFNRPDGSAPLDGGWQYPASVPGLLNDDPLTQVTDVDSIRFSRKPKPIDMSSLKKAILRVLCEKLYLDDDGTPLREEEKTIKLPELVYLVLLQVGQRTEKLMSVPIFIVALMHVIADKKLFIYYEDNDPVCPVVVCRGKNFKHGEHIPMPVEGLGMP